MQLIHLSKLWSFREEIIPSEMFLKPVKNQSMVITIIVTVSKNE